jgi:hypothetical protein
MYPPAVLPFLVLLAAEEAVASGSSHVEATSGAVRITAETPSISFEDPQHESRFHSDWRTAAQPLVDAAIAKASAEVERWKGKERKLLTPWTAQLHVASSWADPSESWSLEAAQGPVCYQSPLGLPDAPGMTMSFLYLCFAEPPPRALADELAARITAAVTPASPGAAP